MDHKSENVSDKTISKLESLDEEINLFSKGKKKQKRQKRTEIYMEGECNRHLGRLYLFQGVCQKETYFYQQESIKEWGNLSKNSFRSWKKM